MKKWECFISLGIVFLIFSSLGSSQVSAYNPVSSSNETVYLGSASVWGNGTANILQANVENKLVLKIDAQSDIVDLYIEYDILCEGLTDEGVVTLSLYRDEQNISWNITQSPTSKSGLLFLRNVEVHRGDSFFVTISAVYGNIVPLYHNETSDVSAMIVPKYKLSHHSWFESHFPFWMSLWQCFRQMRNVSLHSSI